MLPLHGRAVSRERYFRRKKKSSIVWTTLPSQPYVFCIIGDIFCRCTCPPRARIGTLTTFLLCVALSGCYFAFVPSSYHPVAGLRRCCHCTGAQSHENGIFGGRKIFHTLNDVPQSTICLLYYKWYILPMHVPPPRAHWYLDNILAVCCTPIWLLFCFRAILLPSRSWFA